MRRFCSIISCIAGDAPNRVDARGPHATFRMNQVRVALMRADPAKATVTGIATGHGFWELGRFSVAYRTLFGESPSASLRRPTDDRRIVQNRPLDLPAPDFA